jgi:hypothetical protein
MDRKGLNAKIQKELAENEGSTVWSDRRERLDKIANKWETKYAEFESYNGMPAGGTTLYSCQAAQLSNGSNGLNAKILKELAENEEGTVWSERRARLDNCVTQKRRD